ncbi:MAG: hypothetical protein BroJett042_14000 [Bacteroidota bacterium]|nr:MAG: hypothetical protein BroJett042_14000 [Bacteroidota bacterium]
MADWKPICDSTVQEFIFKNEHVDERELVLQHKTLFNLPAKLIAEQIAGRRKSRKKLPLWHNTRGIVYPPALNLEQSSSQATAKFKASFLKTEAQPNALIDLTGGFGVDSFYFSEKFENVIYVEPNAALLSLVQHNHAQLGATTIQHIHSTAEEYVESVSGNPVFYLDPSRRDENSKKIFRLRDCVPDITHLQKLLFDKSEWVLLKASPLLDIQQGLREVAHVKTVIALSVENEMKELLFLSRKGFKANPLWIAIDLDQEGNIKSKFPFLYEQEAEATAPMGEPQQYLYEPNAAIMKTGAFKLTATLFGLTKLAANTHLYTSTAWIKDFPGRVFRIEMLNPSADDLKKLLPNNRAHTAIRNYPLTAQQLMKKLRLDEGGEMFVWGFSTTKSKYVALCKQLL